jgi:hypothetical protein
MPKGDAITQCRHRSVLAVDLHMSIQDLTSSSLSLYVPLAPTECDRERIERREMQEVTVEEREERERGTQLACRIGSQVDNMHLKCIT